MKGSILIAYGSKHGSTVEVAGVIAERLAEEDIRGDLRLAAETESLQGFDGVVLGGPLDAGELHKDLHHLVGRFHKELAKLPLAVFAVSPTAIKPKDVAASRKQLEGSLAKACDAKPFAIEIFGGMDRDAIDDWAGQVAVRLAAECSH